MKVIIQPMWKASIISLSITKIPKNVFAKYLDFIDIFSKKLVTKLLKHLGLNKYAIDLEKGKKLLYGLIYSLKLGELEILKANIKSN